jgi:hypothetical protein
MPTYSNLGIKLIGTGDEAGAWGISTNQNFEYFDSAIVGYGIVTLTTAGSSGSPNNFEITDYSSATARNRIVEFTSTGDLGADAYVQINPNDFVGYWFIRNSLAGARSLYVFQGTYNAARDYVIPNGRDVVLRCDGAGATASVISVFDNPVFSSINAASYIINGNLNLNNFKVTNLGTPTAGTDGTTKDYVDTRATAGSNNLGYLNIPQVSQSAAYTLIASDAGKHILHPSADTTARTWTIPSNASVPFAIGTTVTFVNQHSAGTITLTITSDTMRLAGTGNTANRTLAANGIATAIKVTATEWLISGTGLT